MRHQGLGAVLGLGILVVQAHGAELAPAVTIHVIRPDVQCERVIALFQGARAPHPAAALAGWKHATAPHGGLARSWEAAIAAFNPEMARELRLFDQTEVVLAFNADADDDVDALRWYAGLPRDDGTFAALATSLALSGGGSDPPLGAAAVDRLGPKGWPLLARSSEGLALAGSRADLRVALDPARPRASMADVAALESGWLIRVDPEGLGRSGSLPRRRVAEALRALGCRSVDSMAGLEGETLGLTVTLRLDAPPRPAPAIDPGWLDGLPDSGLLAAFAWAIDPGAEAWDRAFALADRVERADPAHAGVAPLRTRINLLAATFKVRPEVDLWPHLRGLSGAILADAAGQVDGALLVLHTDSAGSAERIAGQVLPGLAPLLGLRAAPAPAAALPAGVRLLARFRGRPLFLNPEGATVRLGWGEAALEPVLGLPAPTGRSIGPTLRALAPWGERPPQRFGAFWPGRLALGPSLGEPLAQALAEAPPVLWSGWNDALGVRDVVRWSGLRDLVRRFLDRIPLDPPPDR